MTGIVDIDLIAAARPNFIKIARLFHVLSSQSWCRLRLIHTGQHYDANMSSAFFADFSLPEPAVHLGIGSGTHAEQTGRTLMAYEQVCLDRKPDWAIVVGDVNATLACSLAATKIGIRVAHVEAGLRSRDREMPEEINRILTDAIADVLWTPSADATDNLRAEGIAGERIDFVGNVMIDALEFMRARIEAAPLRGQLGLEKQSYAVITLHRPSNVDDPVRLAMLIEEIIALGQELPVVFPLHPRTHARLASAGLLGGLGSAPGVTLIEPQGYIHFMNLLTGAAIAITDSGGMQEETTYLGIPCLTIRDNTERPITISHGTNRLIRGERLVADVDAALTGANRHHAARRRPALWDGRTAERIAESLRMRS